MLVSVPPPPGHGAAPEFVICEMKEVKPSYSISPCPPTSPGLRPRGREEGRTLRRAPPGPAACGLTVSAVPVLTHTPSTPGLAEARLILKAESRPEGPPVLLGLVRTLRHFAGWRPGREEDFEGVAT